MDTIALWSRSPGGWTRGLLVLLLMAVPVGGWAAPGFGSAGAPTLFVGGATVEEVSAPATSFQRRTGLWLDVDSGSRKGVTGLTYGARVGLTALGDAAAMPGTDGTLAFAARAGVASSVYAWNTVMPGELLLTVDAHVARDRATWWADGFRIAPRIGFRVLSGYGGALRARLRVDVAPTVFADAPAGIDASVARLWARLGVDYGAWTAGVWATAASVTSRRTNSDVGSEWASSTHLGAGVVVGYRSGAGRRR